MRHAALIAALVALAASPLDAGADTARGVVFHDRDADLERDRGEPGLPGVLVTNGSLVVETDERGRYALPAVGETFIQVVQPPGFRIPLSPDRLPRHFYHHAPTGTPAAIDLRYRGVRPTGPLPPSIDFPLRRVKKRPSYEAILISDPQPQTLAEVGYLRDDFVTPLIGTDAAFGLATGDLMFDDLAFLPRYTGLMGQIGIPWWNVPGNHDINYQAPGDALSLETWKRHFGPPYTAFFVGQALFVILDDVVYHGRNRGPEGPLPAAERGVRDAGAYSAAISEAQLLWLSNLLVHIEPEEVLVAVAVHIPFETTVDAGGGLDPRDRRRILQILCRLPHTVSFAGHTHALEHHYFGPKDGCAPHEHPHHVLPTLSGGWWSGPFDPRGVPTSPQRDGVPNGYAVLHVEGLRYRLAYRPLNRPEDHQLRPVLDTQFHRHHPDGMRDYRPGELLTGPILSAQVPSTDVVVNFFNGGPRSKVVMRSPVGPPVSMTRVLRPDPFAVSFYARSTTKKSFVGASTCTHCWQADLPDLGPGIHTLTFEATDDFGQRYTSHLIVEVLSYGP